MKKLFWAALLAGLLALPAGCGRGSPYTIYASTAFGDILIGRFGYATNNCLAMAIRDGTELPPRYWECAFIVVDRDFFTGDDLIELFHAHISGHSLTHFTIDFGDSTGYIIDPTGIFSHAVLGKYRQGIEAVGDRFQRWHICSDDVIRGWYDLCDLC